MKDSVPLGGRWFYKPLPDETVNPDDLVVTAATPAGRSTATTGSPARSPRT